MWTLLRLLCRTSPAPDLAGETGPARALPRILCLEPVQERQCLYARLLHNVELSLQVHAWCGGV